MLGMPLSKYENKGSVRDFILNNGGKENLTWRDEFMHKCSYMSKSIAI